MLINKTKNWFRKKLNEFQIYFFEKIKQLSKSLRTISNELDEKLQKDIFIQNSLSPKLLVNEEISKIKPYIIRIEDGIKNSDTNNIALMGSYGSGKSTIIKNFEFLHPEYKILNLSLGSYSKKETNIDDLNEKLENSLVKQMIYREKNSELPYSRFKKINRISKKSMTSFFIVIICSIISFLYLKNILNLKGILSSNFEFIKNNPNNSDLLFYCIFSISSCIILYKFFQTAVKQFKLSKLNFANVSIESTEDNFSYFNKYIDEILYYFETKKFDVVVIEDVDRFNSVQVFEHLKELNILLNNSKQINRNITFVYAVKEDIFSETGEHEEANEEHESRLRTKFFELIIPIIPVVDTFNSRDYLVPMMEDKSDGDLDIEFKTFLKDISLYIQDLRLLTNIVNEYFTYIDVHNNLSGVMNEQMLFSMVTLKNLVPSAYTDLQKSQGFLYELIVKHKYEDTVKESMEEELQEITRNIQEIESQIKVDKISETKKYLFDQGVSINDSIYIQGNLKALDNIDKDLIDSILSEEHLEIYKARTSNITLSKSDFIDRIKEKEELLKDKIIEKQKIYDFKKKGLDKVYRLSLQEKLKKYPKLINNIFNTENNLNNADKDFILYVLSNGYVAEDYSTYLSIFYEEKSMTVDDKTLLLKLKSNQIIGFDDKIYNLNEFISDLLPQDYEKQGILNVNILIYICSKNYEDKYGIQDVVLEKLFEQDEQTYAQHLDIILNKDKLDVKNLIYELFKKYNIDLVAKCGTERRNMLINLILYSCMIEIESDSKVELNFKKNILLNALNMRKKETDNDKTNYEGYLIQENILSRPNFFVEIEDYIDSNTIMEIFFEHNDNSDTRADSKIYFEDMDINSMSQELFTNFIRYQLYAYKPAAFSKILNYKNLDDSRKVSYQQILLSDIETLRNDTQINLEIFIEGVLFKLDNLSETESSFEKLVNDSKDESLKPNLIAKSNVSIKTLSVIADTSLWETFLEKEKCAITWENVKVYYKNESMNLEILKSIFNNQENVESLKNQHDTSDTAVQDDNKELLKKLVDNKVIEVSQYNIELLKVTTYDAGELDNVSIQLLVENNLVDFNLANITTFKENGVITDILLSYRDEYIRDYQKISLSDDDLIMLIKKWDIESINVLLETVVEGKSDEFFANIELVNTLMEKNVSSDDELFSKLLNNMEIIYLKQYFIFNLQEGKLSSEIIKNSLNIFDKNNITDFTVDEYDCIFDSFSDNELFVKLLNNIFRNKEVDISVPIVTSWMKMQNEPISELQIRQSKQVTLENSNDNKELLDNLKAIGIVSSFREVSEDIKVWFKQNDPVIK
ncbi:YobI family P-loop NTPase [Carnobacterium divergens]|nr:hypothetical protein [Carnobacterium divergens]